MARKFRFYGGKYTHSTRTISNQVGADQPYISTKRTIPAFSDSTTIYVSKGGNNSNAGTYAAPKLTIQAACTAAAAASKPNVVVQDSGVYTEIVNCKNRSVYALANNHPTIQFPAGAGAGVTYTPDNGEITEANYFGTGEFSLRGIAGVGFTGTIANIIKSSIDGFYWMATNNGIWYSRLGSHQWQLLSGTGGWNFDAIVEHKGALYAHRVSTGIYKIVDKSAAVLDCSVTTGTGLVGNEDFLMLVTNTAYGDVYYLQGGVWKTFSDTTSGYYIHGVCHTPFKRGGAWHIATYYYKASPSLVHKMDIMRCPTDTTPPAFTPLSNNGVGPLNPWFGHYDEVNNQFYYTVQDTYSTSSRIYYF